MRIGMGEVKDFCLEYFPSTLEGTFLEESCGIADIITSCELEHLAHFCHPLQCRLSISPHLRCLGLGGRNRQIAENMVKTGKSFRELEESMLQGQKLQGPQTADEVHKFLEARGTKRKSKSGTNGYPLFEAVWKVCYQVGTISRDASNLIEVLCRDYHLLSLWNCYELQL